MAATTPPAARAITRSAATALLVVLVLAPPARAEETAFAGRILRLDRDWGDLEVGQTDGASGRLMVTGPASEFWPTGGIGSGRSAKAAYFADLPYALRVGVSYAPVGEGGSALGDARHLVEGAVRHHTVLGGVGLDLTVGGVGAQARNPLLTAPLRSLMAGGQLMWRSLTVGAAVRDQKSDSGDRRSWNAGVAYAEESWAVRAQVARTVTGGTQTSGGWNTAVRYDLTPGLTLTAGMSQSAVDDETTVMRLGTRLRF